MVPEFPYSPSPLRALGTGIGFKFQGTCGTVKITISSIVLGSAHPISRGKNVKAFPCLSSIPRNICSSSGRRKSSLPFRDATTVLIDDIVHVDGVNRNHALVVKIAQVQDILDFADGVVK